MATKKPGSPRKRLSKLRLFLVISGALFLIASLSLLFYVVSAVAKTPDWDPQTLYNQKQTSLVYDKDNNLIAQLHAEENRNIAKYEEIPELVRKTFIAVEDKRFNEHFGIDPVRILGALAADVKSGSMKEGASTITTQLANNAFIGGSKEKNLTRKIQEAALAVQLERHYTKNEILTFYLNRIFLGQSSFGVKAAAKTYFGKELKDLTPPEVALLAGLPQAPTSYNPFISPENAKTRRNVVLGVMRDSGIITADEFAKYKDEPFTYVNSLKKSSTPNQKTTIAQADYKFPYFVDYVVEELQETYDLTAEQIYSGGLKIYTTVDPKIQKAAEDAFADPSNFPQAVDNKMKVEGAITVLEPSNGAIRAMVGGRDYTTKGWNRAYRTERQPGSTIKPLVVYAPAIEKGGYFPGTVLDDMPVKYNGGDGKVWAPVNFDTEESGWKGLIPMRYAVENSVNVYAVKLLNLIGVDYGWKFAKEKLGLPLETKDKVLSLALGTNHASTLDMASAYGVFPNNGVRVSYHSVEKVLNSNGNTIATPKVSKERVMKETTAYIMNSLLRSVVTNGTGVSAQFGNWAVAGKTGTTSLDPDKYGPYKSGNPDAWFAGYTPLYSAVVWMGYDEDPDKNHYLRKVYGGSYPAKIWKKVMTAAHQDKQVITEFKQPAGIVSGAYDKKSGLLPSSLTPTQFIGTEIAAQGDFPTKVSDIWVEKQVDAENPNHLANEYTRNTLTKVFLNITDRDPEIPWPSNELPYKMPSAELEVPASPTDAKVPTLPPIQNANLPVPTLGPAVYNASKASVTIPLINPPGTDKYSVVIYVKLPGQNKIHTYTPENATGKSKSLTIVLGIDDKPVPGDYIFWAAYEDPKTSKVGPPSNPVKLTLND